jgi:hypothetical protein
MPLPCRWPRANSFTISSIVPHPVRFRTRDHVEVDQPVQRGRTAPRIAAPAMTMMLIVRGVNVFLSHRVVSEFAPKVSGHILVKPVNAGVGGTATSH